MQTNRQKFDIIVIGGGPAGILAAGRAAELGAKVALLEKNPSLGKKLLLTGNGRCNLTQAGFGKKELAKKFGPSGKFLLSSLNFFGPEEVMDFFQARKLPLQTETDGRVFPASNKAPDVLAVLRNYLKINQVKIFFNSEVTELKKENEKITSVKIKGIRENIAADKFILCTGGKSYPQTGSTGAGYFLAEELGHTIITPSPALVPIKIKEKWVKNLQGVSFKGVAISLWQNNKKQIALSGDVLFTHFGLSGPAILNLSKQILALMQSGETIISLDFLPDAAAKEFQEKLEANSAKNIANCLAEILPLKIISAILNLAGIALNKKARELTKDEKKKIIFALKNFRLTADGALGFDQAMITSGDISLKEIHSKTMQSRIISNLFLAGEALDLDGPTGGYNLQMCWSTGYAAGVAAAQKAPLFSN